MKKYIEPLIVILLTTFIISLSFYPTIDKFINAPKDTIYFGTHNFVLDYSIYISVITQGQQGNLLAKELHTGEPQFGSLSHIYYLLAGLITGPFKIPPFVVYHLLRLISAFVFAGAVYWFICLFVEKTKTNISPSLQRIALFFLSYASAGFPLVLKNPDNTISYHLNFSVWSGFDVVRRSAFLPHGLMQNSLTLFTIGLFIKYEEDPQKKYLILAGIMLFITNLFSPFHSGLAIGSYFLYSLFKINRKNFKKIANSLLLLLAFFLPTFIYIQYVFSVGVLAALRKWDAWAIDPINFTNYILGLGPIFFLGVIGLLIAVRRKGYKYFFLVFITIITIAFLFILKLDRLLGINNYKFLGIPLHVFLGILSFYTISALFSRFKKAIIIIIVLLFLQSIPVYSLGYNYLKSEYTIGGYPYNIFLPSNYYKGLLWIKENTNPKKDIILSKLLSGNLIPAVSGNQVYIGHYVSTINFAQKSETANKFFSNDLTAEQGKKFLKDNSITYVFYSYEESTPPDLKKYPFLTKVYSNPDVNIFKLHK